MILYWGHHATISLNFAINPGSNLATFLEIYKLNVYRFHILRANAITKLK